jgi:hypothetical protein
MDTRTTPLDDHIPFNLAAKSLKVSRRTVERMAADGRLEVSEGTTMRSVTRRSLVTALKDDATIAQASQDAAQSLDAGPLLAVLDQLREANEKALEATTEAAALKVQVRQIETAKDAAEAIASTQDALVEVLLNGTRQERRKARKEARRKRQDAP